MVEGEALEFVDEDEVEVAPFAHDLALLVALLPAVPAMAGRAVALVGRGLGALVEIARAQPLLEGVEDFGDVIVELRAR